MGIVLGIGVAELYVRFVRPLPPIQIVRGHGLHLEHGTPVWEQSTNRQHRACVQNHPERIRVFFMGSSITFGSGVEAGETFTALLEDRLNKLRPLPGFCILNFAQAGFSFDQKLAVAQVEIPRYHPELVMWENWLEWFDLRMMGDTAYGVMGYKLRPDGFFGIRGVPDGLNHLLFVHSRLYERLALSIGEQFLVGPEQEKAYTDAFVRDRLPKVPALAASVGARLAFYPAPRLDRPFRDAMVTLPSHHPSILQFGREHGIPVYPLQNELAAEDYLQVRLDPCCHYNARGHQVLAGAFERIVLEQLDASKPPSR